jgi:hypothetical protein
MEYKYFFGLSFLFINIFFISTKKNGFEIQFININSIKKLNKKL